MPLARTLIALLILAFLLPAAADARDERFEKAAPWDRVDFVDDGVRVRVDGTWYALVSIDGAQAADVLAFCKERYGRRWDKRFAEDLVEVLAGMDKRPGKSVDLVLRAEDGTEVTKTGVPMTEANRRAVWRARQDTDRGGRTRSVRRVSREHATKPDPRYAKLVYRVKLTRPAAQQVLTPKQAQDDLDQLEWHITHEHSYAGMNDVDYRAAFDTIRLGIGEGISRGNLALQMHRVICLFGDGHARIRGLSREVLEDWGYIAQEFKSSLWVEMLDGRPILVFGPRDGERPYAIEAINDVPIGRWFDAARDIVPRASRAYVERRLIRDLRYQSYLRTRLGLDLKAPLTLHLRSLDGKRTERLSLAEAPPWSGFVPPAIHMERRGDVGYLRILEMSGERRYARAVDHVMSEFRDTKGLVIDVRGNGGGTRDILRALLPYFLSKDEMHVCNVAAYRIPPGTKRGEREGYLANRYLYPVTSRQWSDREREHIQGFLGSFAADLVLPDDHFSAWHVMLVTPKTNPAAYRYHQRVVILMDGGCFSATDVFLGAFKGRPGVTLMGTPSGGGSGRSKRGQLAHSGIRFRLSTMASFQPSGERYDGKGIQPDVLVEPSPEDFTSQRDSVLERALATAAKPIK
ncbi:MAG: S41 family peptidase [Planctomycetota bacterium]|nr:S41 family peptidase [Planctomycetota bacterium]